MNDSSTVTSESTPTSIHRNTLIARVFLDAKIVFPASVSATLPRNPLCIEWERISLRFYQSYNTRSCFELLFNRFRHLNFVRRFPVLAIFIPSVPPYAHILSWKSSNFIFTVLLMVAVNFPIDFISTHIPVLDVWFWH